MSHVASSLQDKCILITGSSRGIGAGIAHRAAELGARVAVTYGQSRSGAEDVAASLPGSGHIVLHVDMANEESIDRAIADTVSQLGRIDGLVNNAGITSDQLLLRMKSEEFDRVIAVNLRGTFLATRAAAKLMLKARAGSIVNITSVVGQTGNPGQANYSASKAGIEAMTRSVALELASRQVRANCVAPGFIATEMTGILTDAQKQNLLTKIPLGRIGETDDVANAVCFLLSEDAKYITGHTLSVNGGLNMQ